jgi:hypothetical protein
MGEIASGSRPGFAPFASTSLYPTVLPTSISVILTFGAPTVQVPPSSPAEPLLEPPPDPEAPLLEPEDPELVLAPLEAPELPLAPPLEAPEEAPPVDPASASEGVTSLEDELEPQAMSVMPTKTVATARCRMSRTPSFSRQIVRILPRDASCL